MNNQYFRKDVYWNYQWFWGILGFVVGSGLVIFFVQHKSFNSWMWLIIILMILALAGLVIERKYLYLAIKENNFIISRVFWKNIIPIPAVIEFSYQYRITTYVLVIKYEKEGKIKEKEFIIENYNTNTILEMNESLKKVNPKIEIVIDEGSNKFLEQNKNVHKKAPTTKKEWITFSIKWFLVGLVATFVILYILVPRSK
ncbi:MAG: hypothetical protein KGJ93_04585 [Patescibacteria group bacterium]|nr:hypothetical protein [Patescibacteria group bacterium]